MRVDLCLVLCLVFAANAAPPPQPDAPADADLYNGPYNGGELEDVEAADALERLLFPYDDEIREKRGRRRPFCLRRHMTCPKSDRLDLCCDGSQCSCNLFGQNCRCSTVGLIQRLG